MSYSRIPIKPIRLCSGLFAMHASVAGIARQVPMAIAYNGGRLLSYSALGLLVAVPGSGMVSQAMR